VGATATGIGYFHDAIKLFQVLSDDGIDGVERAGGVLAISGGVGLTISVGAWLKSGGIAVGAIGGGAILFTVGAIAAVGVEIATDGEASSWLARQFYDTSNETALLAMPNRSMLRSLYFSRDLDVRILKNYYSHCGCDEIDWGGQNNTDPRIFTPIGDGSRFDWR